MAFAWLFTGIYPAITPSGVSWQTPQASAGSVLYVSDAAGRLAAVIDPASNAAVYKYDAVGNILSISQYPATQVSIIAVNPNNSTGSQAQVCGTGFSTTLSQNTVTFNGVTGTVLSVSGACLIVSVPANATTGTVTLTTPTGSATSGSPYVITPPPTITGFTPTIGGPGTAVTITGTGFSSTVAMNKVSFNTAPATINAATATSISTVVPDKTGSGKVTESTPYGTASSVADFFIPPSGYTSANIEVTERMTNPGGKTISITQAGKIGMIVFDGVAGQNVGLLVSNVSITQGTVSILKPDNTTFASTPISSSGGSIPVSALPATGTYTILIVPGSTYMGTLTLQLGAPDLTLSAASVGTIVANPDGSHTIPVTYTVTNTGTMAAQPAWYDLAYLSSDAVLSNTDVSLGGYNYRGTVLAAGASYTVTVSYTTATTTVAGSYTLFVKADGHGTYTGGTPTDSGNLTETNESNNTQALSVTLSRPDLTLSAASVGTIVANPDGSHTIPVTYTVTNTGTMAAQPAWYDLAYLSSDAVLSNTDVSLGGYNYRGTVLAAGASYTVTVSYTTATTTVAGSYTLFVKADGHGTYTGGTPTDSGYLVESNESNNTQALTVTLSR